jgi:hypothetical protein
MKYRLKEGALLKPKIAHTGLAVVRDINTDLRPGMLLLNSAW